MYLIDYGLACRYITNGQHKELKEDRRKAHDGTIEFTSRDAHIGGNRRFPSYKFTFDKIAFSDAENF